MTGLDAAVAFGDVAPRELRELAAQPGLVALHRQHPVRAAGVQVGDVVALGVQRVGGDHHAGQVDAGHGVEQRGEPVDLTGLAVHGQLSEHDPGLLIDHGEQMPPRHLDAVAAGVSGAAYGLAVHRQHAAPSGRGSSGAQALHERADHGVESIRVDRPEHAADGRLRRAPPVGSEQSRDVVGHVGDPLGDRDERPGTGRDGAHRSGEHDDQAVADTTPLARIGHPAQRVTQTRREHDRIGQLRPAHLVNDSSDRQR